MMGLEEDRCERSRKLQEYVAALEEERRKMEVFRRELPLCLDLVAHAIKIYRQQAAASEPSSSETSGEGGHPILEEFIPLKPSSSSEEENSTPGHHHRRHRLDGSGNSANNKEEEEKSTESGCWLQLWNDQNCSDPSKDNTSAEHAPAVEEGGGGGEKAGHHHHRKARRCWSPELHRQFLHALQKLGGSHVATPKQIREVMKVDGLSNDEVKSHLQKYRLHTRQPSPAAPVNNGSPQTPQLVLGIWVPPYSTVAAAAVPPSANGTYSSIPSLPLELKQSQRPSPSDSTATLTSS